MESHLPDSKPCTYPQIAEDFDGSETGMMSHACICTGMTGVGRGETHLSSLFYHYPPLAPSAATIPGNLQETFSSHVFAQAPYSTQKACPFLSYILGSLYNSLSSDLCDTVMFWFLFTFYALPFNKTDHLVGKDNVLALCPL